MKFYTELQFLLALANLGISGAIGVICGCRIDIMSRRTKLHVRLTYAFLFAAALASGLQPIFFREWPGVADMLINSALLTLLLSGRALWPKAVPEPYTCPGELDEAQHVHIVGGKGGT